MLNELLITVLEKNEIVFWIFAIAGVVSFIGYTSRGIKKGSNTCWMLIPVMIWLVIEKCTELAGITIAKPWAGIGMSICVIIIVIMAVCSFMRDFGPFAFLNIIGNLFIMYTIPHIIYLFMSCIVIVTGGMVMLIGAILLMAGISFSRITYIIVRESRY